MMVEVRTFEVRRTLMVVLAGMDTTTNMFVLLTSASPYLYIHAGPHVDGYWGGRSAVKVFVSEASALEWGRWRFCWSQDWVKSWARVLKVRCAVVMSRNAPCEDTVVWLAVEQWDIWLAADSLMWKRCMCEYGGLEEHLETMQTQMWHELMM